MSSRKILPTKINLITLKRNVKLVRVIKRLLENKREVLLLYLRNFANEYEKYFNEVSAELKEIYGEYLDAISVEGLDRMSKIATSTPSSLMITTNVRTVFGVKIPTLTVDKQTIPAQSLGVLEVTPKLVRSQERLKDTLDKIIRLAELEATIRLLVLELKKTQRLINAVDYSILPSYNSSLKYIKMVLEDRQREEFVRLKVVRRILDRRRKNEQQRLLVPIQEKAG